MTVLFDIGNVLIGVDFPPFYERVFGVATPDPEVEDRFIKIRDLGDTGRISKDEFAERTSQLVGGRVSPAEVVEAWNSIFFPIEPMWEVARRLNRDGHRLILFSNTNRTHLDHLVPLFPILQDFVHGHFSCEIGAIKPDAEFYEKAIERYELNPAETLYFDDLAENIAAGEEQGFRCFRYDLAKHDEALAWLGSSS